MLKVRYVMTIHTTAVGLIFLHSSQLKIMYQYSTDQPVDTLRHDTSTIHEILYVQYCTLQVELLLYQGTRLQLFKINI